MDPSLLTLRELQWMAEGRHCADWNHTATVLAMLANVNRDPAKRSRPFEASDFHPVEQHRRRARQATIRKGNGWNILKQVFVDRRMPAERSPT